MAFYEVIVDARTYRVEVERGCDSSPESDENKPEPNKKAVEERCWRVRLDGREVSVDAAQAGENVLSLILQGKSYEVRQQNSGGKLEVFVGGKGFEVVVRDPRSLRNRRQAGVADSGPQKVTASMPGKVVRVLAGEGERIAAGQGILVMEAMKMQNEVRSPKEGTLKKLQAREGMNVNAGDMLAIVE